MSNICIVGNDNRMNYVAECLFDYGYEVYKNEFDKKYDVIVFEPVLSTEFYNIIPNITKDNTVVFAGKYDDNIIDMPFKVKIYDYLKFEDITAENAILTAKGIVNEAVHNSAVIEESRCLVIGYGFCGKALSKELYTLRSNVDIMVRNKTLQKEILDNDFGFVNLNSIKYNTLNKYSYVFNTVPAKVVDRKMLDSFSKNVMIYDIASKPGGVDFDYCKEKNIYVVHSLGIPGRHYPSKAGYIIGNAIHERIKEISPPN